MEIRQEESLIGLQSLYRQEDLFYFSTERVELIELINRADLKILEVGCGQGNMGKRLLETGIARWVTGVELIAEKGEVARTVLNDVRIGNVENMTFDWKAGDFDCLVFGDVLEHLTDPWGLLRRLRSFLANDGIVVASIPNVKHWSVLANLILRDDWKYAETGVLDVTHLRFFTRSNAIRLFSENGYRVETTKPYFNGRRYSIPSTFTLGTLTAFLAERWLMRAVAA